MPLSSKISRGKLTNLLTNLDVLREREASRRARRTRANFAVPCARRNTPPSGAAAVFGCRGCYTDIYGGSTAGSACRMSGWSGAAGPRRPCQSLPRPHRGRCRSSIPRLSLRCHRRRQKPPQTSASARSRTTPPLPPPRPRPPSSPSRSLCLHGRPRRSRGSSPATIMKLPLPRQPPRPPSPPSTALSSAPSELKPVWSSDFEWLLMLKFVIFFTSVIQLDRPSIQNTTGSCCLVRCNLESTLPSADADRPIVA